MAAGAARRGGAGGGGGGGRGGGGRGGGGLLVKWRDRRISIAWLAEAALGAYGGQRWAAGDPPQ